MPLSPLTPQDAGAPARAKINVAFGVTDQARADLDNLYGIVAPIAQGVDTLKIDARNLYSAVEGLQGRDADVVRELARIDPLIDKFQIDAANLYRAVAELQARTQGDANNLYRAVAELQEQVADAEHGLLKAVAEIIQRASAQDGRIDGLAGVLAAITDGAPSGQTPALFRLVQDLIARRNEFRQWTARPGDAPVLFTLVSAVGSLGGADEALPPLPAGTLTVGDAGASARVVGPGIVATRRLLPIEPNRAYRMRTVVQRRTNASDPSNDTVRAVIVWLDRNRTVLPGASAYTLVRDWPALLVANGRVEVSATFARAAGDAIDIVAPPAARYARTAIVCFGLDAGTDIEVLGAADVSDALLFDPISSDIISRVAALESGDLGDRLSAVESQLQTPNSLTFASRTDAAGSNIPATVTTIALRGVAQAGDGRDGLYGRVPSLPAGADGFTSQDGARWLRIVMAPDLVTALLRPWIASLPTEPPAGGGPWLNGGGLAWS